MTDRHASPKSMSKAREKAVSLATDMLEGRISYFEGAHKILALRSQIAGIDQDDPDFDAFALIESETDHLPLEKSKYLWSASALTRIAPEFSLTEEWAAGFAPRACRNIIERFAKNDR